MYLNEVLLQGMYMSTGEGVHVLVSQDSRRKLKPIWIGESVPPINFV